MSQFFVRAAAMAAVGCVCATTAIAQPSTRSRGEARPGPVRSILLLDNDWQFYPLPDFQLWPAEAAVTPAQIRELTTPELGKGWQPAQLPDDYVVRGKISREPNTSLLAKGAVCPLGGRECEIPNGAKTDGSPGALNRPGRGAYAGHGYLPVYPAWYQRTVFVPETAKGKSVWLDFGGVYRDAVVFVNGQFIDQHASGYTAFRLNITSSVRYGDKNNISVFVDPRWFEGWWYEGGGIYRHVRLIISDPLQVAPWGTFVDAQVAGPIHYNAPNGDHAAAQLTIQTTVRNDHPTSQKFTLVSQVIDSAGKVAASNASNEELASGQEATFSQRISLPDADLWSLEYRNLYKLATTIRIGPTAVDSEQTSFGVRTIRFDPEQGFFLNGKHVEIHGMCVHQDFPGVGIAAPDNLWAWRVQKLKEIGANAYRTAHGPVAEEFYNEADRMGLMVMDESRHLGDTYFPKAAADTPYSDLSDVKGMVLQHRNHPSIIMWSLANEEGQGRTPYGARMFAATRNAVRALDPSRPTTSAMNGGYTKEGFISVEDILGMNYHNPEFSRVHDEFPRLMIFGSEDVNAKSSRGALETSRATGLCSAYGDGPAPDSPGAQPWNSWAPVADHPFVAGEFVWTGFDYRGEPNPFSWPAVTSQTGAMDLCGFPKPVYYYWKAAWQAKPLVYIFPDWNLPKNAIGDSIRVRSFSNCERIELSLNGKSLGTRDMPRNQYLDWQVPYAPGILTAVGYNQGKKAALYTTQTSGAPAALRLIAEVSKVRADGEAVAPIRVEVVDAAGRIVPDADPLIEFSVSGAGTLAGVANGNPASDEPNLAHQRQAFHGLAMVLVKAAGHTGSITIRAHADGLPPARILVPTTPATAHRQQ